MKYAAALVDEYHQYLLGTKVIPNQLIEAKG